LSVLKGRKWIWISGVASRGLVLKNAPDVPAAIVQRPLAKGRVSGTGQDPAHRMVDDVVERDAFGATRDHPDLHMILQVVPNPRCIEHDIDAVLAQQFRGPDAGDLQQLRRVIGAA
jgi:hypothetical protein